MDINAMINSCKDMDIFFLHKFDNSQMPCAHFHDGYEITITLTDGTAFYVEDKSYEIKSGTISIFNENEIHIQTNPDKVFYERYNIHFEPQIIQDMIIAYPVLTKYFTNRPEGFEHCILLDDPQKENLIGLFKELLYYYQNPDINFCGLKIKFKLCEILLAVNDIYSANDKTLDVTNREYKEQLNNIMEYIKNNLTDDLRLDVLMNKFYMSKTYINKIFRQTIGMTPRQYIIYWRVMKSREFLKQGISVNQVRELVGYDNTSEFIRTFKKLMGCTPKEYQKST